MVETFFPDREFKAYLFDFDGTIADTMGVHFVAWNKALETYGVSLTRDQHLGWAGRPTREIVKLLSDLHEVELSPDEISKAKEIHYTGTIGGVKAIVPVVDIIKAADGKVPMAIVSGSRRKQVETTLRHLQLEKYFDVLVCAEDYKNGKPDPDCFLMAAEALRAEPKDCLVFEDGELGIESARRAGMECLRVSETADANHALSLAAKKN